PAWKNVLHSMWERGWSFIKRAGTVIVVASIFIWFTSGYGWAPVQADADEAQIAAEAETVSVEDAPAVFGAVENMDQSMLGRAGSAIAPVFRPLGFDNWQSTVATIMGLVAKEEVVGVFGVLYGVVDEEGEDAAAGIVEDEDMTDDEKAEALSPVLAAFDASSGGHGQLAAFCFLIFNLLCAPCFAAMGAIKREMNNGKWTAFAIAYQCVFAYVIGLIVYQLGLLFSGAGFTLLTAVAVVLLVGLVYMLVRRNRYDDEHLTGKAKVGA
ncbi:MAG: nucleoside recognition domain-containing protein, partial [Candidatus Fimadaptatus sp.]